MHKVIRLCPCFFPCNFATYFNPAKITSSMPLIVFEGIDGSGKDTQVKNLATLLKARKIPFALHKYPTKKAGQIRTYLSGKTRLAPKTRFFLYLLDILLGQEKIKKELQSGKTAILDRYVLSTCAYSSDPSFEEAKAIVSSFQFLTPDRIFLLDLPPELSQSRKKSQKKLDIHESNQALLASVRENYLALFSSRFLCKNWVKIDASKNKEAVFAGIEKHLRP